VQETGSGKFQFQATHRFFIHHPNQ
jgi:hypothetical protein